MSLHERHMGLALKLAERGRRRVSPNPMVGAVIARGERIVAEGWHIRCGGPHAEIAALSALRGAAQGATLYVTLEPCHHHGKTPPCVDAVIKAGFSTVVIAMRDPNPATCGKSVDALRQAGIEVVEGVLEDKARALNHRFIKRMATGRPWVIAKWAMTIDGRIATPTGDSKWVSSEASLDFAHDLRDDVDAVIVGLGTVLKDNPLLTCRRIPGGRNPVRVILDSQGRLRPEYNIIKTIDQAPTWIAVAHDAPEKNVAALRDHGCEVLRLQSLAGVVNLSELMAQLSNREIGSVLIEGGSQTLGSAFDLRLVDEAVIIVAPKILGGRGSLSPIGGEGRKLMNDAMRLADMTIEDMGEDRVMRGTVKYSS